jgi:outer membrane protein
VKNKENYKMKKLKSKIFLSLLNVSFLNAYEIDDPTLGNIAIEAGIWNTKLDGNIKNTISETNFKDDLRFDEKKNVTFFGVDLKNDYSWLPNIYVNYFTLNASADGNIASPKLIADKSNITSVTTTNGYDGVVSSVIDYTELNTIFYGYLQQSIFEFDVGINFKKIDYTQTIKENDDPNMSATIKGPDQIIPLPYAAVKIDLYPINTVLKAETSMLALGDDEAKDYSYSLNFRVMKHMYLSYGYRYTSWKTTNKENAHEKYDMNLKGNYINAKILF